jgi:predicted  nucleic acid-binding Zn-ribbon protein
MNDLNKLENNLYESFTKVKSDIIKLNTEINKVAVALTKLSEEQTKLSDRMSEKFSKIVDSQAKVNTAVAVLKNKKEAPQKVIIREKKVVANKTSPKKQHYVASKTGKKFHVGNCIFAQNIKPKSKIIYKSKITALNDGYKSCDCVTNRA